MADINALMGLGITDEEQLRELADQLRGRQKAADFFSATTVPSIRGAANREQEFIADAAKQAGVLKRALDDRTSREKEREKDRAAMLERAMLSRSLDAAKPPKIVQKTPMYRPGSGGKTQQVTLFDDGTMATPAPGGGWTPVNPNEYEPAIPAASLNKAVSGLSEDARDADKMIRKFYKLHEMLAPYKAGGEQETPWGNIPGTGMVESKEGVAGTLGEYFPNIIKGDTKGIAKVQSVKALIQEIANVVIREQSGLTQTKGEIERVRDQLGKKLLQAPEVQLLALQRLQSAIMEDVQNMRNRSPQVVDAYLTSLSEEQMPVWEKTLPAFDFPNSEKTGMDMLIDDVQDKPLELVRQVHKGKTYVLKDGVWYEED